MLQLTCLTVKLFFFFLVRNVSDAFSFFAWVSSRWLCWTVFSPPRMSLLFRVLCLHSLSSILIVLSFYLQVPSCLILQMPRFGKKFKMFEKIIPSLELDITDLLSEGTVKYMQHNDLTQINTLNTKCALCVSGPQQCMLCGNLAHEECTDCFKDSLFSPTGFKIFCKTCSAQVPIVPLYCILSSRSIKERMSTSVAKI